MERNMTVPLPGGPQIRASPDPTIAEASDFPYVNYHRHTCYSNVMLADSVVTNEDYARRAVELGHAVLSSCEHGIQGNYWQCSELAKQYGLRWRYVSEAYFVKDRHEKDNANCHLILAAKTRKGIGDMNFALSEANISGYYYRPRVDLELLMALDPRDVFVTTACVGGVFKYGWEDAEKLILRMASHFRDSFMLEVQYHDTDKQREVNRFLLGLYRRHGIPQAEVVGEWRSAPMVAFGTLKRLSAWKMFCRAANLSYDIANEVGNQLKAYEQAVRFAEEGEEIILADYVPAQYRELVEASEQYMGVIDSISPHPCAYLLCREDIRREIGIIRLNSKGGKKKTVFAAFIDGATAESFGYLKNDLLLVEVVKTNHEAFRRIGMEQPGVNELLRLVANDRETWRMYADGLTMGLNQVEQPKTREKVMQYKPRNITELAAFVAAVRPAFKSMLPVFLARKHFDYGIPAFDRLIQTREMTSSFILFQEQLMKTLQHAGFTAPESYAAIKAISKKHPEKVLPLKQRFLEAFAEKCDAKSAEKVWQIMEDATSYLFNSSHAVCVAMDSLYGAWLKANYPLEYYTTLLSGYAAKGDKDRIALVKEEMQRGFGIRVVPCKFRQDNRDFYIDHAGNTISDAQSSVKHVSRKVADALYRMKDEFYVCFTDLLYDMEVHPAFDSQVIEILIRLDYFREFGGSGKLQKLYREFRNGEFRFSKTHIQKTQEARLKILRRLEGEMPEEEIPPRELIRFEIEHCGTPVSTFPELRDEYAVLEVDDRYSPRVKLCSLATGRTGVMKLKKALFKTKPLEAGEILRLLSWERKPAYTYVDGKARPRHDTCDLWITGYEVVV